MFKMNMKNNLDERQELALLKIESKGCWLAFWGLLISMGVQMVMYGPGVGKNLAGEWIVFMILCLYILGECKKAGIYDRHLKPNTMTNLVVSLIAGLAMGLVCFLMVWKNYSDKPLGALAAGIFPGGLVFVLCFISLQLSARSFKKRQAELEKDEEDDMVM